MKFRLTPIPSNLFTYDSSKRVFVTEASDLNGYRLFEQIYDDAADVGFGMVSTKTGKIVIFTFVNTLQQLDDRFLGIGGWLFRSECGFYECHIYND